MIDLLLLFLVVLVALSTAALPHISPDGSWPATTIDAVVPTDPDACCGPWRCEYYDNLDFTGTPAAVVIMDTLSTDWQKKPGYGYDGVPVLQNKKNMFSMRCSTQKDFVEGAYQFMPFARVDNLKIFLDGSQLIEWNQGKWLNPQAIPVVHINASLHRVVVEAVVTSVRRNWVVLSWVRVQPTQDSVAMTDVEKIACMTSPVCFGPMTECRDKATEGLGKSEAPWGLCRDFVPKPISKCLVYAMGIRDIYSNELLMGREGCEVHAFDCTINHPATLGKNVHFHPWCLGAGKGDDEFKLDGARRGTQADGAEFLTLPAIIRKLGHEDRLLTVLKMDCEGCEWDSLDILLREMPTFFNKINMLMLELHFVTTPTATEAKKAQEISKMARVAEGLHNHRVYGFSINSDLSMQRFHDTVYYPTLYNSGVQTGACCYEITYVRVDLALDYTGPVVNLDGRSSRSKSSSSSYTANLFSKTSDPFAYLPVIMIVIIFFVVSFRRAGLFSKCKSIKRRRH